jgi:uncharacterized membrane protein (UPF0127 family)
MAGQVIVTIGDKEWFASLASDSWELVQGLGGIPSIDVGTGMLFDMGFEQEITVTTEPMFFNLDIAFFSEAMVVTEIYRNIQPGYLVTSTLPARYFLEVNAGELDAVNTGSQATFEFQAPISAVAASDWVTPMISFMGFTLMGIFAVGMVASLTKSMVGDQPKTTSFLSSARKGIEPRYCRSSNPQCAVCEKVSPRDYAILSWVGVPVPDYSFAVEPAIGERKIDEVLKRLKDGVDGIQQSENFRKFLLTMSKFHEYSIGNLILIMLQKPNAARVAGFNTWRDLGRWVNKGEKGIAILAPCMSPKETKPASPEGAEHENEEEEREKIEEIRPLHFKVVYVFDISQTEGKPLPEFGVPSLTGEANEALFNQIIQLTRTQGLEVGFESRPQQDADIKGMYFGKSIWVRPEESRAQQLKTLIHEVAHYYSEGVFRILRRDAETIAESVAFVIGAHFGFDTGTRSFPYVALWSKDKKVLEQNLAAIRKVSAKIIEALEKTANKMVGIA